MPFDPGRADGFDAGVLSPVSVGADWLVADAALVAALVRAEVALTEALGAMGTAPDVAVTSIGRAADSLSISPAELAAAAVADGNPVGAIVARLRAAVDEPDAAAWVHRGATSQDILDTAMAILARDAIEAIAVDLRRVVAGLADLAGRYRDIPAAARTLTQHAVPTTLGARFADWLLQVADARDDLLDSALPAQLGGAAGTLASLADELGVEGAMALVPAFAAAAGLDAPSAPWHTRRTAVTRLGDALARTSDALGRIAADVATLSRTEIGELAEGAGGGSTAMPQKRNPVRTVLIRSASLRAPGLAATLHVAAATAVDERPDGAWHAEWPALRELLRLVLGASAHAAELVDGLVVDEAAVARNLAITHGLIVSERLVRTVGARLAGGELQAIIGRAGAGEDLEGLLSAEPALAGVDVAALLEPAGYLGITGAIVDHALARARTVTETA